MKLGTAIAFSALLVGCAVDDGEIELDRTFPDNVEVVVIGPNDNVEVDFAADALRPEYPEEVQEVAGNDHDGLGREPLPGPQSKERPGSDPDQFIPEELPRPEYPGGAQELTAEDDSDSDREALPQPEYPGQPEERPGRDDDQPISDQLRRPEYPTDAQELAADDDGDFGREAVHQPEYSDAVLEACECLDTECLEEWIANHLGCDVCATFTCLKDTIPGACVMCE